MKLQKYLWWGLVFATLFLLGCSAAVMVGVGAGAGIGSYSYIKGELKADYPYPYDRIWDASLTAIQKLEIEVTSRERDALGGKITGAGGGGCMIFFCKSNCEHKVSQVLQENDAKVIDFSFEKEGMVSWELQRQTRK